MALGARRALTLSGLGPGFLTWADDFEGSRTSYFDLDDGKSATAAQPPIKAIDGAVVLDFAPRTVENGQIQNSVQMRSDLNGRHGNMDTGHVLVDDRENPGKGRIVNSGQPAPAFKVQLGAFSHAYLPVLP